MLSTIERRQEIMKLAQSQGKVMVEVLAKKFSISTVTIRNDLNDLDRNNMLVRCRGGAIASTEFTRELSVQERYKKHSPIKQRLGREAVKLINQGESIIIDSGTTTEEIAHCLTDFKDLTVMTNGLNISSALATAKGVEVLMTGGILRHESMSFYGRIAEKSLLNMHFDKFFLGTDGVDFKTGITTFFEPEASLNRLMCDISNEIIVVMDSSKIAQSGIHVIRPLAEITTLVTDTGLPDHYAKALERAGVNLHLVKK